mmetsp:Transcript_48430/g.89211  ORF Transcript_48430/g.89211 Transcript_48430/m.89211 type:complete len:205 (-) Transcript_48430:2-616(-)
MEDGQQSLKHLLEAAHMYAIRAPAVSRSLILHMRALANRGKYKLHSSVAQRFCERCSQVAVPGWNCQTVVAPRRRRRRRKRDVLKSDKAVSAPRTHTSHRASPAAVMKQVTRGRVTTCSDTKQTGTERRKAGSKRVQQVCWLCGHQQLLQVVTKQQPPADAAQARKAAALSEATAARAAAKRAKAAKKVAANAAGQNHTGLRTL